MAPNGEAIPFNQRLAMAAVAGGCGGLVGTPGTYVIQNINQRLVMAMARYNSMYFAVLQNQNYFARNGAPVR